MKNNASFLLVTATAVAAMALCFGSIADFDSATPQIASKPAPVTEVAPAAAADTTTHRIE